MATVIPIHKSEFNHQHYSVDENFDVLTKVYDEDINLVVYKREVSSEIIEYVDELLMQETLFSFKQCVDINKIEEKLETSLPDHDCRDDFIEDVCNICDMYAALFDLEKIGLRLAKLEHAMCLRFHVDNVHCRLLTTYGDIGTDWLAEENLNRKKLGRGSQGVPDKLSGVYLNENNINSIGPYDIALLKGEAWPNNEGKGLVHRSPAVNESNPRLILSLDIV